MNIDCMHKMLIELFDNSLYLYDDWMPICKIKSCKNHNDTYKFAYLLRDKGLINIKKNHSLELQLTQDGAEIVKLLKKIEKIENKKILLDFNHFDDQENVTNNYRKHDQSRADSV